MNGCVPWPRAPLITPGPLRAGADGFVGLFTEQLGYQIPAKDLTKCWQGWGQANSATGSSASSVGSPRAEIYWEVAELPAERNPGVSTKNAPDQVKKSTELAPTPEWARGAHLEEGG